jgi:hypothetical protein
MTGSVERYGYSWRDGLMDSLYEKTFFLEHDFEGKWLIKSAFIAIVEEWLEQHRD